MFIVVEGQPEAIMLWRPSLDGRPAAWSIPPMTGIVFIYVTHPDAAEAGVLGWALVQSGFAACVNILPGMHSIYRWQGGIEAAQEAVLIVKTRAVLGQAVQDFVRARHPYACPCLATLPVVDGDPSYLDWIAQSSIPCQDTGGRARDGNDCNDGTTGSSVP